METVRYGDLFPHEVASQRCHRRWSDLWACRPTFRFESTIHGTRHYLFSERLLKLAL